MKIYNPLLLCDNYKCTHDKMYPADLQFIVAYYTPRMSRLHDVDKVTLFGLQGFIKEYLINNFNEGFFKRDKQEVLDEYWYYVTNFMNTETISLDKIAALHDLGYLPLKIRAVPEGTRTAIGVPQIEISNTLPGYVWLVGKIESLLSCSMWHTQVAAEVGYRYWNIVKPYYDKTCDDTVNARRIMSDFSMRGQHSVESAIKASAAWALSFEGSATIPTAMWLEENYGCDISNHNIVQGVISTEHSVMCSNCAIDGNEVSFVKRMLTEIYPHDNFTMVVDSYDYWKFIDTVLPACKKEIAAHDGIVGIRGDSGDPVDVVVKTVEKLADIFTVRLNDKGYKVLNGHVKVVYGDSITPERAARIFNELDFRKYAISNVSLGAGSFSHMCLEQYADNKYEYKPYTRDTFGIAVKATYGELADNVPVMIYKNPVETSWKKSQKGCCIVAKDGQSYIDGYTFAETELDYNLLQPVFADGKMLKEYTFDEIRHTMYPQW